VVTEFAPARLRSTSVVITMIGYSLGSASGGPVSNALIPRFGWEAVFIAGGVASLLAVVPVVLFLPESVKFLAEKDLHHQRIAAILRRALPDVTVPADARFVVGTAPRRDRSRFTPADLFRGGRLALITPIVWLAYMCSSAIVFYLAFWGPIRNERIGFSVSAAATLAAWTAVAGAAGQLLIGRFIDHRGAGTIAWMPLLAVPCLMLIGLVPLGAAGYIVVIVLAHVFVIGGHGGVISICGIFYRPAIRANGAGWATSMAKFGAMLGPWLAGFVMDHGLDARGTSSCSRSSRSPWSCCWCCWAASSAASRPTPTARCTPRSPLCADLPRCESAVEVAGPPGHRDRHEHDHPRRDLPGAPQAVGDHRRRARRPARERGAHPLPRRRAVPLRRPHPEGRRPDAVPGGGRPRGCRGGRGRRRGCHAGRGR
jgi:predicted MFS family arabinose efflux permease